MCARLLLAEERRVMVTSLGRIFWGGGGGGVGVGGGGWIKGFLRGRFGMTFNFGSNHYMFNKYATIIVKVWSKLSS